MKYNHVVDGTAVTINSNKEDGSDITVKQVLKVMRAELDRIEQESSKMDASDLAYHWFEIFDTQLEY